MQKISVVERVYSMPVSADHEKFAADNNGVLSSVESSTCTFMDTRDKAHPALLTKIYEV